MPFVSYAPSYQDVLLWRAFGLVADGFYIGIDVGAYYLDEHSITRAFYDRGWTAISLERVAVVFAQLFSSRRRYGCQFLNDAAVTRAEPTDAGLMAVLTSLSRQLTVPIRRLVDKAYAP